MIDLQLNLVEQSGRGSFVPLLHPVTAKPLLDEQGQGIGVILAGHDSQHYQQMMQSIRRRNRDSAAERERNPDVPEPDTDEDARLLAAACVLRFVGFSYGDLSSPEPHAVANMFRRDPWIYDQIAASLYDRARFLNGSVANWSTTPDTSSEAGSR